MELIFTGKWKPDQPETERVGGYSQNTYGDWINGGIQETSSGITYSYDTAIYSSINSMKLRVFVLANNAENNNRPYRVDNIYNATLYGDYNYGKRQILQGNAGTAEYIEISLDKDQIKQGSGVIKARITNGNFTSYYQNKVELILDVTQNVQPSTGTAKKVYFGETQTIQISNNFSGTLYHKVTCSFSDYIQTFKTNQREVYFTVPSSRFDEIFLGCSKYQRDITGTCVIETFNDSSYSNRIGQSSFNIVQTMPSIQDTQPTATVSIQSSSSASEEEYVQNKPAYIKLNNIVVKYGAEIQEKAIQYPGSNGRKIITDDEYTIASLPSNGDFQIDVIITDSRGISGTITTTINVEYNANPVFLDADIERCDDDGKVTDEGEKILVTAKVIVSKYAHEQGSGNETLSIQGESISKIFDDEEDEPVKKGDRYELTYSFVGDKTLNPELSYTFTLKMTDKIGQQSTFTVNVSTALYTIYRMAGGKGVAFGQAAKKYGVEVNQSWPFYTHGQEIQRMIMDFAHPVNSILETINMSFDPNTEWPWTKWSAVSRSTDTLTIPYYTWIRIY